MKVTATHLSYAPFVSVAWKDVRYLSTLNGELCLHMIDTSEVRLPLESQEMLEEIFAAHDAYLQSQNQPAAPTLARILIKRGPPPIMPMEHDSNAKDSPDLPQEVLDRMTLLGKLLMESSGNVLEVPKAHEGCNCFFCQISRKLHPQVETEPEEEVSESDLQFCDWDVKETGPGQFAVTHKIEGATYQVHLNEPLGCTCGSTQCEHIAQALKS